MVALPTFKCDDVVGAYQAFSLLVFRELFYEMRGRRPGDETIFLSCGAHKVQYKSTRYHLCSIPYIVHRTEAIPEWCSTAVS